MPSGPVNKYMDKRDIIQYIEAWAGGRQQAISWYEAQPIPAFGGRTAASLVREGRVVALREYLDHIEKGGFA